MISITNKANSIIPPLKGLVLAGGKSSRLGQDKSSLKWHGKEQMIYLADVLQPFCEEVFISRKNAEPLQNTLFKIIEDSNNYKGPSSGIYAAFTKFSQSAWLVVACDLPFFNYEAASFLVKNRDHSKIATAYKSPRDESPEPLAAIWEPQCFEILKGELENGINCPRKILMKNDIQLITAPNPDFLKNINTIEDMESVKKLFFLK